MSPLYPKAAVKLEHEMDGIKQPKKEPTFIFPGNKTKD